MAGTIRRLGTDDKSMVDLFVEIPINSHRKGIFLFLLFHFFTSRPMAVLT